MSPRKKVSSIVFNNFTNDSRVLKEAISLSKNGYTVDIIAHLDKGLPKEQKLQENVVVKRVSYLDRTSASTLTKIKAYLKFLRESIAIAKKSDIVHCNDLNAMPVAFVLKRFYNKNIKIVYDAHKYETQMNHFSERTRKIMYFFEKRLIKYADAVITVSDSIANEYVRLYPKITKPSLVLNCPSFKEVEKKDKFRERFGIPKEATIFLYQGSLTSGRGLEIIIEAFEKTTKKDNVLVMMGYGNLEKFAQKKAQQHSNIYFHEAVSPNVLLDYTSSADFGIATIENTCLSYYYCLPNKMFEYIMAGVPVIVSDLPEMKKVVTTYNIGVVAKENSSDGILKAIEQASQLDLNLMKENLNKAKEVFNWQKQEDVLVKTYTNL